jgi:hypothetical protein
MVGVVVRGKHTDYAHTVGLDGIDECVHVVRGVDKDALTRCSVTDCINEIDHLAGKVVVLREIAPRKQLAEVKTVGDHDDEPTRAYP